jgi:hypothetical protein
MEGWTSMEHLPEGEVREARNRAKFPAGETERIFEITNWNFRYVIHHGFGDAPNRR